MKKERRKFTASFKVKVAIEALKEKDTLQVLASKFKIHPTQKIGNWKKEFLENAELVFSADAPVQKDENREQELFAKIGELQVQVDFLKKVLGK
jgi:transposase